MLHFDPFSRRLRPGREVPQSSLLETQYPGHCCPYCVNPNVGWEAPIVGATGKSASGRARILLNRDSSCRTIKLQSTESYRLLSSSKTWLLSKVWAAIALERRYGGKESLECPNVWCFPLMSDAPRAGQEMTPNPGARDPFFYIGKHIKDMKKVERHGPPARIYILRNSDKLLWNFQGTLTNLKCLILVGYQNLQQSEKRRRLWQATAKFNWCKRWQFFEFWAL